MRAGLLFILSLAAAPVLARAGEPVVLEATEDATKAELDQCATALQKRFAAASLKGLKAAAVEKDGKRTVEVTSKVEIPSETRAKIVDLARIAGDKPAVRFSRAPTAEEKAQGIDYDKVDDVKTAKAPPGMHWADCLDEHLKPTRSPTKGGFVMLLQDTPYVNWSEVSVTAKGTDTWELKLSAAATRILWDHATGGVPKTTVPCTYIRIAFDRLAVFSEIKVTLMKDKTILKEGTFTLPAELAENLDLILRNPMPRALKIAGAGK